MGAIGLKVLLMCVAVLIVQMALSSGRPLSTLDPINESDGDVAVKVQERRNVIRSEEARWPNAEVVYTLDRKFSTEQKDKIEKAMQKISNVSCVTFRPADSTDMEYLLILSSPNACSSTLGYYKNNNRTMELANGCFNGIGVIVHEFLHTLGFYHQQNDPQRDKYVKIHLENVQKGREHNFNILSEKEVTNFGVPYDYNSIMHYAETGGSKNGKPTIEILDPTVEIGQSRELSKGDIIKINKMYKCAEH